MAFRSDDSPKKIIRSRQPSLIVSRTVPHMRSHTRSTTPHGVSTPQRFQITHPYHPLFGQEFELVQCRHNWGEDRVYFHGAGGHLTSVPASWTSLPSTDPFIAVAAGRSLFRIEDLLELAKLLGSLRDENRRRSVR
jgi:Family of unknown function (DUF5372)